MVVTIYGEIWILQILMLQDLNLMDQKKLFLKVKRKQRKQRPSKSAKIHSAANQCHGWEEPAILSAWSLQNIQTV